MSPSQKKKQYGILWLYKDRFDILFPTSLILSFHFTPETIRYLEIVDEKTLEINLQKFLIEQKITSSKLCIVLSQEIVFEKNISTIAPAERETQIKEYLGSVPFDVIYSQLWNFGTQTILVVFNGEIYKFFERIFEKNDIDIDFMIPSLATGKNNLDSQTANIIIKKVEELKKQSEIHREFNIVSSSEENNRSKIKKYLLFLTFKSNNKYII